MTRRLLRMCPLRRNYYRCKYIVRWGITLPSSYKFEINMNMKLKTSNTNNNNHNSCNNIYRSINVSSTLPDLRENIPRMGVKSSSQCQVREAVSLEALETRRLSLITSKFKRYLREGLGC